MNSKAFILKEITDMMAYHSRVAQKPFWFSWDEIWDIMNSVKEYSGKKTMSRFPSVQEFAFHARTHPHIIKKKVTKQIAFNEKKKIHTVYAYTGFNDSVSRMVEKK